MTLAPMVAVPYSALEKIGASAMLKRLPAGIRDEFAARGLRYIRNFIPGLDVPWQRAGDDGTHYASFATWMCPINCVEPARCPHTKAARDWTMPVALQRHQSRQASPYTGGPYVFHCTHRAYGVGMIDVAPVLAADADLRSRAAAGPVDVLVGTVSHCHGAVSRLVVRPPAHSARRCVATSGRARPARRTSRGSSSC